MARSRKARGSRAVTFVKAVPADYILRRRELFSFHNPTKGPDGRVGEIDQDVCDGIGQLHALGLLEAEGGDPVELRNAGRKFAELYWQRYWETSPRTGKYERVSHSYTMSLIRTYADDLFDIMDASLPRSLSDFERRCVMELCVETYWGDDICPWAQALIDEGLRSRGRERPFARAFVSPGQRRRLAGCIEGLRKLARWKTERLAA